MPTFLRFKLPNFGLKPQNLVASAEYVPIYGAESQYGPIKDKKGLLVKKLWSPNFFSSMALENYRKYPEYKAKIPLTGSRS